MAKSYDGSELAYGPDHVAQFASVDNHILAAIDILEKIGELENHKHERLAAECYIALGDAQHWIERLNSALTDPVRE